MWRAGLEHRYPEPSAGRSCRPRVKPAIPRAGCAARSGGSPPSIPSLWGTAAIAGVRAAVGPGRAYRVQSAQGAAATSIEHYANYRPISVTDYQNLLKGDIWNGGVQPGYPLGGDVEEIAMASICGVTRRTRRFNTGSACTDMGHLVRPRVTSIPRLAAR